MKIDSITIKKVAVPFREPESFSTGKRYGVNSVLVVIGTDVGIEGIGESIGRPSPEIVESALLSMKPWLLNRNPEDLEAILSDLRHVGGWHYFPRMGNVAIAGIEMALWDIKGKVTCKPIFNLLGGMVRKQIPLMYYLFRSTIDEMVEQVQKAVEGGFKTIYLKVGQNTEEDVACIKAIREAIGDDVALRIDANEAWSPGAAVRIIKKLEDFHLEWVEQPTPSFDLKGLARVRKAVKTPIAADQACWTINDVHDVISCEAADVLVLDQYKAGGLWEYKKAAAIAEAAGIPVNHHAWGELGVGFFAGIHVVASTTNFLYANQSYILNLSDDVIEGGLPKVQAGCISVPEAPGIGVRLDSEKVEGAVRRYELEGAYLSRIPFENKPVFVPKI